MACPGGAVGADLAVQVAVLRGSSMLSDLYSPVLSAEEAFSSLPAKKEGKKKTLHGSRAQQRGQESPSPVSLPPCGPQCRWARLGASSSSCSGTAAPRLVKKKTNQTKTDGWQVKNRRAAAPWLPAEGDAGRSWPRCSAPQGRGRLGVVEVPPVVCRRGLGAGIAAAGSPVLTQRLGPTLSEGAKRALLCCSAAVAEEVFKKRLVRDTCLQCRDFFS